MKNSAVRSSMVGICVRVRVNEAAELLLRLSMRRHIIMEVKLERFRGVVGSEAGWEAYAALKGALMAFMPTLSDDERRSEPGDR